MNAFAHKNSYLVLQYQFNSLQMTKCIIMMKIFRDDRNILSYIS